MPTQQPRPDDSNKPERGRIRIGAILAAILAVVLVGWLVLGGDDDSSDTGETGTAEAVSVDTLRENATERGMPIYWAGPQEDAELELTETDGGDRTYVRYLTGGAQPGDTEADLLTVGTYAFVKPAKALQQQARGPGGVLETAPGGGTVYYNRERPQSVYLAYPGVELQIEVYDPDPKRALNLVTAGQIVPVS